MTPLRMLFCSPVPVDPRRGAAKVYIEVAAAVRQLGCETAVVGPDETGPLRDYLRTHAARHDVVEYEHNSLPFPRSDFPARTLFVARSVLLAHVLAAARIPPLPTLRGRVGWALKWWATRRAWQRVVVAADRTLAAADLINLPNATEADVLVRRGCPPDKILVQPFGLFPDRLAAFAPPAAELPGPPAVAFVGTFDPRKGLCEFPRIVASVLRVHPTARFRLIGTAGLIPTVEGVLRFFPRPLRPHLEVVPRFDPAGLPRLLTGCSAGVFPSRCEGFPFGVLEMLAAGLPVVGYDAPGMGAMLPPEWRTPPADGAAIGERVADLLADPDKLRAARRWARERAAGFRWADVARATVARYAEAITARRDRPEPVR